MKRPIMRNSAKKCSDIRQDTMLKTGSWMYTCLCGVVVLSLLGRCAECVEEKGK